MAESAKAKSRFAWGRNIRQKKRAQKATKVVQWVYHGRAVGQAHSKDGECVRLESWQQL